MLHMYGGDDPGNIARGITVTRNDDTTLKPNDRTKKVQSFYSNGSAVLFVSNHINAEDTQSDFMIMYNHS